MAWFRCFICGENFPGQLIGKIVPVGFYVTRFVEAVNAEAAESAALQSLRDEPILTPPPGYARLGQARVYFEEIEELAVERVSDVPPGFVWHSMDEADAESPDPAA